LLFTGRPFGPGNTDTIYRRLEDAVLPRLGSSASVPIEMIRVGLQSSQPISVDGRLFDASIALTPGKRSTGEMSITLHSEADGTEGPHGTYNTNVAIFFDATLTPRDGASPPTVQQGRIFIQSTTHGLWSLNPAPRVVTVSALQAEALGGAHMATTNFFVAGITPMLDVRTNAGGANGTATF
jgi:hypothetical protein